MVVAMMKWRPWPPLSSKKYETKIIIKHIQGFIKNTDQDYSKMGVEIIWKGGYKTNNPLLFRKRSVRRNVTKDGVCKNDEIIEWDEEFVTVCNFIGLKDGGFCPFEVTFKVFDVSL